MAHPSAFLYTRRKKVRPRPTVRLSGQTPCLTADPGGPRVAPRVLGVAPRVLGVAPRVLGVAPRVLGVAPRVLGVAPRVVGLVLRVLGVFIMPRAK